MTTALNTLEITVITEVNSPPAPATRKSKVFFATSCQLTFTFAKYPCSSGSSSNCTTDQLQMSSKRGGISTVISWILDNSSGTTILMIKKTTPVKKHKRQYNADRAAGLLDQPRSSIWKIQPLQPLQRNIHRISHHAAQKQRETPPPSPATPAIQENQI